MTIVKEKREEMTQNQITALLDYVEAGKKLIIWYADLFKKTEEVIVISKEPNTSPLRQITRINLEGGGSLERKKHSENDFTNWRYCDKKLNVNVIVLAVTIKK